jgi:hypothetical protein
MGLTIRKIPDFFHILAQSFVQNNSKDNFKNLTQ